MMSPVELLAIAEAAVDEAEAHFTAGLGASPARFKGEGDFATEVDLVIERQLRQLLTTMTGIPVWGEEYGLVNSGAAEGQASSQATALADAAPADAALSGETYWVVDPIDGTANYSAGNPMCGILVALIHESRPVAAVASFPLIGRRLSAAEGGMLRSIGGPAAGFGGGEEALGFEESRGHVGCSSHLDANVLSYLMDTGLRPRMTGSVGLDAAFVAQGVFDGAVNFSEYAWDNAAGALLVKAAGGVVTGVEGEDWSVNSRGLVVGTPQVHATLMDAIGRFRPAD